MLTERDRAEIQDLSGRGWTISAIARHTGHDRKTVRSHLARAVPRPASPRSCLEPYRGYLTQRLADAPDASATELHGEVASRGFERSYVTFARQLRLLDLRREGGPRPARPPVPEPGAELQFGWLELAETPWGEPAYVLVGALAFSGRCRAVISEATTFAHLVEAIDGVLRRLGGTPRVWSTDRLPEIVSPRTGAFTTSFQRAARHYGAEGRVFGPDEPRRGRVIGRAMQYVTRSWWRGAPVGSIGQAQADLDRWALAVGDRRRRDGRTIAEIAARERLRALPPFTFPAQLRVGRVVSRSAYVAFEGNRYGVSQSLAGEQVTVSARTGELHLEISFDGRRVARHRRAPPGAGQTLPRA